MCMSIGMSRLYDEVIMNRERADMRHETVKTDITIVGAGLAGVNAAIAAARLGRKVALVNNRPVLGGNSSSEVRVWVCGATAHGTQRYARETGIMGELFLENQYRNQDGNPYIWDLVLLEAIKAEPNIQLYLNTDVHEVDATGDAENRTIHSVTGWMMGSERKIRFESAMYVDCSGDGLIGFLAGAKHRIGREAKSEYGEEWAPEVADDITLGSTILFYTKDAGHPVPYIAPSFAKDISKTTIPESRIIRSGDSGCHYWWIEWGGERDTVHDNERIRDELWSVIYGIWDYIKNSGKFDADTLTLEWVGSIPGKREYRRFVGDYVLTQNDIVEQKAFADGIAFGGWSIDLHPPQGMYATQSGSKHMFTDGVYTIPYRSLYSGNVSNLMFAGRNISASHVAFGTTRVMATCAVMGEAAGTAAALCAANRLSPRAIGEAHLERLLQTLLRQDASLLGVRNRDERDLARKASVTASSARDRIAIERSDDCLPLTQDIGWIIPVDPAMDGISLLIDAKADTVVEARIYATGKKQNYVPKRLIASDRVFVNEGVKQWIAFKLEWEPEEAQNAFIVISANERIHVHICNEPYSGVLSFVRSEQSRAAKDMEDHDTSQPLVAWSAKSMARRTYCFRVHSATMAFMPDKIVNGMRRPYGGPNMWVSEPLRHEKDGQWIQLQWNEQISIREIHAIFNDDVNEDLINLHRHRTPFAVIPELVKRYRIEAMVRGEWTSLCAVKDNRRRRREHALPEPIVTDRLRLVVEATNGCPSAEVVEIRVY